MVLLKFLCIYLILLLNYKTLVESRSCPIYMPNGRTIDNCDSDKECKLFGFGTMCCSYCGTNGCNNYCRGTGTNGDDLIGGGNRRKRSNDEVLLLKSYYEKRVKRQMDLVR